MKFIPAQIIKKKRDRQILTDQEIQFFINSYTKETLPEYQMSALLMAIFFNGMNSQETSTLTQVMLKSGLQFDFTHLPQKCVDKHSTGGVGDKTSLILGPIVAAAGVPVPMIAGRGLGHTGGTLDKLESLKGFSTQLKNNDFQKQVENLGLAIIGQTPEICPADRKLYSLRDVTATVESLPLICGSIMSKKMAEGIRGLVLDVKFGSGAFMKTEQQALELAQLLKTTGEKNNLKVHALLTNMNQPLGHFIGNALEVEECLHILKSPEVKTSLSPELYQDTLELSLQLAGHMIYLGEKSSTPEEGYQLAEQLLNNGQAYQMFQSMVKAQGGQIKLPDFYKPEAVLAQKSGYISQINTEALGYLSLKLEAGRKQISDTIDPSSGIGSFIKVGQKVSEGDLIFNLYGKKHLLTKEIKQELIETLTFNSTPPPKTQLIERVLL